MAHVRRQIRDAVRARLTGLATTAGRLERASPHPVAPGRLPAIRVTTPEEAVTGSAITGMGSAAVMERALTVALAIFAAGGEAIEDDLDAIAAEVEAAVYQDDTWGGLANRTELASTRMEVGEAGERRTGMMELSLTVHYRAAEGAPGAAL